MSDIMTDTSKTKNFSSLQNAEIGRRRLRICTMGDFFFPNLGGVESHMYNVA